MGLFRGFLVVAFFAILGAACKPQPTFPTTPALTFKEFIQPAGSDSLRVVFSFTDGDGDIGLLQTDTDSNMVLTVYAPDATGNFIVMDNFTTPQIDSLFYIRIFYKIISNICLKYIKSSEIILYLLISCNICL